MGEGLQHDDGHRRSWPPPIRRPWSTTPRSPTRWPPSWRRRSPRCSDRNPRTASGTSRCTTRRTRCRPCPRARTARRSPRHHRGAVPLRRSTGDPGRPAGVPVLLRPHVAVAVEAQRILAERYEVAADTWAVTSWTSLRTDALEVERWNRLHPEEAPRRAVVTAALGSGPDPWWPSPTTSAPCPTRWRASSSVPTARSGPTASGAPTRGSPCGRTSRSTAPTSSSPCFQQLALGGRIKPSAWPRRSPTSASTRPAPPPSTSPASRSSSVDPPSRPRRSGPQQRHEGGERVLCAGGHGQDERAAGPPPRRWTRRRRDSTASRVGPGPPPRCTRSPTGRAQSHRPRAGLHRGHRRGHQGAPSSAGSPSDVASRLQAIGSGSGAYVIGVARPPGG